MKNNILVILFTFFVTVTIAHAQEYQLLQKLPGVGNTTNLADLVSALINIMIAIGVLLAVMMLSVGGFQYMGQEAVSSKEDAKKTMTQAILGLMIIFGAYLILYIINPDILHIRFLN